MFSVLLICMGIFVGKAKSDCGDRHFHGLFGHIASPNFPLQYDNNLDCDHYIGVASGQTVIITFMAFNTVSGQDWVMLNCESGNAFRSPRYSGSDLPPVLTISSCNKVNVFFHTDGSISDTGFRLTYNITSDNVIGGFTTKPSNAFPRADKDEHVIFNCTTTSQYLPWWTINYKSSRMYTLTNATCGVITSAPGSSYFMTESLGRGSCNLIVVAPANYLYLLTGSLLCTDSTLSSARAIMVPVNLKLRLTRRTKDITISCNPAFTDMYSSSSVIFTYFLNSEGHLVQMRILRTYWTSEGNVISSTETSNTSSYVMAIASSGVIPRYTCNIVFDFFSNISDISANSTIELSSSTEAVNVETLLCDKKNFSGLTGQISSPNFPMAYANYLDCSSYITVPSGQTVIITFLAFNTETSYDYVTITCESGKVFASPRYSGIEFAPVLTISSCNLVNVYFFTDSSATNTGFSLTYTITSDIVIGGITTKPSNAFPRSDKNSPMIFNCTTRTKHLPWWTINAIGSSNYTLTDSTCRVIASVPVSFWFKAETLGPGSCNLIVVAPASYLYLMAGSFLCTDSTLSSARAIMVPMNLELNLTRRSNSLAKVSEVTRDEEMKISCNASFTNRYSSSSVVFTYFLYRGGPVAQIRMLRTYWTSQGNAISSTGTHNTSSYLLVKAPKDGEFPPYKCIIVCDFFSNISDNAASSSIEISFSTEPVKVLYWPTEDNMRITGDNNGQMQTSAWLHCNVSANPPANYTWEDESNGKVTNGQFINVHHGGKYTCKASNIIRGQHYEQSKSINLQLVEDKTHHYLTAFLLIGVTVPAIIIILGFILCRTRRQLKRNSAAVVGHINHGDEHELRQRGKESSFCEAQLGNDIDVDEAGYDKLDDPQRRLPHIPNIYDVIVNPGYEHELRQTAECNVTEAGSANDIDV